MHSSNKIYLYDTTLRDGAQGEGISFSDSAKVRFAHLLDEFGIDFIEGGFAGSNPRDRRFFEDIRKERLSHAQIVAFGSTRRVDLDVEGDPQMAGLLAAETAWVTIYGKGALLHVRDVLRTTPESNLQIVADSVGYLRAQGRRVIFDAEQFFDGYKEDRDYALSVLACALREGAETLVLCDTNGGSLPHEIFNITQEVCRHFPGAQIGIHTHNDSGLAVANSLEAVRAGAHQVQGCINGYGERTGNANLTSIVPALELKMGRRTVGPERLRRLRNLSLVTDDLTNQRPDTRQPYVGRSAFSHKAGAHVNAISKNAATFEHIEPEAVGNQRHVLVSELSGASNVLLKAAELGLAVDGLDKRRVRQLLEAIKTREEQGYSYESADGSFKILLQKELQQHTPFFELEGFRVIIEKRSSAAPCLSEATVKIKVGEASELTAGEGSGPVDALNAALRQALTRFDPQIARIALSDYRVRILDPEEATRAVTRVVIESSDGQRQWGTVGVSENIIEASWQALLDSIEYQLYEGVLAPQPGGDDRNDNADDHAGEDLGAGMSQ